MLPSSLGLERRVKYEVLMKVSKSLLQVAALAGAGLMVAGGTAWAAKKKSTSSAASKPAALESQSASSGATTTNLAKKPGIGDYVGLNYFTFWSGPGLGADFSKTPNMSNRRDLDWSLWTNLSVRGKVSSNLAVDAQFRLQQFLTNDFQFLYQGIRLGVSGTLLKIERPTYKLVWSGAINSEVPGVGQIAVQRKQIVNPGMFSNLTYRPTGSRFSLFALVSPRVWFYGDADAMDAVSLRQGSRPGEKPQYVLSASPSLNYDITEKTALRTGVGLDVRKNMNTTGFRRWFMPVDVGVSHTFNSMLSIYPNISFSGPWDDGLRQQLGAQAGTRWTDTLSVGMWLNGTIL